MGRFSVAEPAKKRRFGIAGQSSLLTDDRAENQKLFKDASQKVVKKWWPDNPKLADLLFETAAKESHFGTYKRNPTDTRGKNNPMQIDPGVMDLLETRFAGQLKTLGAKFKGNKLDFTDPETNILAGGMAYKINYRLSEQANNIPKVPSTQAERATIWKDKYNTVEGEGTEQEYLDILDSFDIKEEKTPKPQPSLFDFIIPSAEASDDTPPQSNEQKGFFNTWGRALKDAILNPFSPVPNDIQEDMKVATEPEYIERKESNIEQWIREGFPTAISDEDPRDVKTAVPKGTKEALKKVNDWFGEAAEKHDFWFKPVPWAGQGEETQYTTRGLEGIKLAGIVIMLASGGISTIKDMLNSPQGQAFKANFKTRFGFNVSADKIKSIVDRAARTGWKALTKAERNIWNAINDADVIRESRQFGAKIPIFKGGQALPKVPRLPSPYTKFYSGIEIPKAGEIVNVAGQAMRFVKTDGNNAFLINEAGQQISVALDKLPKITPKEAVAGAEVAKTPIVEPISEDIKPLIEEAKKFKTAEEFVEAQGKDRITVYRGISQQSKEGGNYWSTDKEWARQFTQTGREEEVRKVSFQKNAIYKADKLPSAVSESEIDIATKEAKEKGYNAILVDEGKNEPNSVFVINPSKAVRVPKQQLTDIFNKAQEKLPTGRRFKVVPQTIGGIVNQSGGISLKGASAAGWSGADIKALRPYIKEGGQSPDALAEQMAISGEFIISEGQTPSEALKEALLSKQLTTTELEKPTPEFKAGFKEGWREAKKTLYLKAKSTKASVEDIKKTLTTYIKDHLSPEDRGKLITQLRDIHTKKGLVKAIERVDKIWEKGQRQGAVSDLKKTIKGLDLKKLRPEYQKEISNLVGDIDLKTRRESTIRSLTKTKEYLEAHPDNNIPPKVLRRLDILEKKKIKDLDIDDIALLSNTVKHLKKLHDLKNKLIIGKKYREAREIVDEAVGNVRKAKSFKVDPQNITTKDKPTAPGVIKETFTTASWNPELITEILDKQEYGIIQKVIYKGIDKGTTEMLDFRHEADDFFKDKLKGIDMKKWSEVFTPKPSDKTVNYIKIDLPSGKTITMTRGERIAFNLHARNEKNLKHLLEGGFAFDKTPERIFKLTSEDLDVITKLNPEEQKVADAVHEYLNIIQKDKINKTSVELNGWEIATEPDYFPIRTNYLDRIKDELKASKNFSHKTLEGMGILKERVNASNAIILEDAFTAVYKSIKQVSSYVGMAKPLRNAKMLLNDNKFQRTVALTYGYNYIKVLRGYLEAIEGASHDTTAIERLTLGLINKLDIAVLGLNPWVMGKQVISLEAASTEIDVKYLANLKPESTETMSKWSPQLRDRFQGNVSRELGEIGQVGEVRNFWTHQSGISQKLMAGIRRFDFEAIGRIWKGVEKETKTLHPNLTGDEKMRHIAERTEEIVRKTQPTFNLKDRSEIGRSRRPWLRLATKYSSQRNKNYMIIRRAQEKYNRSQKTAKDKKDLIKRISVVAILMPLALWGIDELRNRAYRKKPTKRPMRSAFLKFLEYNLGNVYFIGNAMRSIESKIERGTWAGYDISDIALSTANRAVDAVVDIYSTVDQAMSDKRYQSGDKEGETKWQTTMTRAVDESLSTVAKLKGLPYDTIKKLIEIPFKAAPVKKKRRRFKIKKR